MHACETLQIWRKIKAKELQEVKRKNIKQNVRKRKQKTFLTWKEKRKLHRHKNKLIVCTFLAKQNGKHIKQNEKLKKKKDKTVKCVLKRACSINLNLIS